MYCVGRALLNTLLLYCCISRESKKTNLYLETHVCLVYTVDLFCIFDAILLRTS